MKKLTKIEAQNIQNKITELGGEYLGMFLPHNEAGFNNIADFKNSEDQFKMGDLFIAFLNESGLIERYDYAVNNHGAVNFKRK